MFLFTNTNIFLTAIELLAIIIGVSLFSYYLYYKHCFQYWKKKKVPTLTAQPKFPSGDLSLAAWGKQSTFVRSQEIYEEFRRRGCKYGGIYFFNGPIFFPVDPDIIKRILISDFDYFIDRGFYENPEKVPLSSHIFTMKAEQWKHSRLKFTPSFTSGKMKSMFNIVVKHSRNLVETITPLAENGEVVDIKTYMRRYSCDIVGSTSFGIDCNSLKYPNTEFVRIAEKIFIPSTWKLLKVALEEGLQNPGNLLKTTHDDKEVEEYFTNLVRETIEYRDKNNVSRDDFLNILIKLRDSENMSFREIVAQSYLFFTAGFETTSLTIAYCIHELAHNQELQDRIRGEIYETIGTDITKYCYEDIMALSSLDKTVKETLRKYPPAAMLNRICVKDYRIPDSDVVIEKGTPVVISLLGLQRDPEFYPEPDKFDPERFDGKNHIVPYTFLPFGDGPKNCIGLRFGYMQVKMGLASLLNSFRFLPSSRTPRTLSWDPRTSTLALNSKHGVFTKMVKIQ